MQFPAAYAVKEGTSIRQGRRSIALERRDKITRDAEGKRDNRGGV
jgi:hypothetical protein